MKENKEMNRPSAAAPLPGGDRAALERKNAALEGRDAVPAGNGPVLSGQLPSVGLRAALRRMKPYTRENLLT